MGESISEYVYVLISGVLFALAVTTFFLFISLLGSMNRVEIDDMNRKTSITMDSETGYQEDLIYVKGSEVFADILSLSKGITVSLNGSIIPEDKLSKIRENDPSPKKDLYSMISMNDEYIVKHEYYINNEIKAVSYTHR
jgi:hypothetical protein